MLQEMRLPEPCIHSGLMSPIVQILWGERRGDYIHRRGCKPSDGGPVCTENLNPDVVMVKPAEDRV
jgi:hypothetical protein